MLTTNLYLYVFRTRKIVLLFGFSLPEKTFHDISSRQMLNECEDIEQIK